MTPAASKAKLIIFSHVGHSISLGVAKFNVGTRLKRAFLDAVLERTRSWSGYESVHDLVGSHKRRAAG